MTDLETAYLQRYAEALQGIAEKLQLHISRYVERTPRIDRVSARAKSPDRFIKKADKRGRDGIIKYDDPLYQIQDQVAARIVVFYLDDIASVDQIVKRYFKPIEEEVKVPESDWEFGYEGKHYVLFLPEDVIPDSINRDLVPEFFELQIKTLFQHAWSEASHDLVYKGDEYKLSSKHIREFAFTAAQAWGADQTFQRLFADLKPANE